MKLILQFMMKRNGMTLLIMFSLIGQVVGTLIIPYLIANLIDLGIMQSNMQAIINLSFQMFIVALATSAFSIWAAYLCANFGADFGCEMREALFIKTQELSKRNLDELGIASLIIRTTSDITNIQQTLVMILQMIIPAPLIVLVAIWMTSQVNGILTNLLIGGILLFIVIAAYVLVKSHVLSQQIQKGMDRISLVVRESILGIRVIRAFDNSKYEQKRSDETFDQYATTMISLNRLFAIINPAVWLIMGFIMAAILAIGGYFSVLGEMALGEITSVSEYAIMSLSYLIMASFSIVTLPKMFACLARLHEVLTCPVEILDPQEPQHLTSRVQSLDFDQVTFAYHGAQYPVLHHLSFHCISGQTTAIIGGTGSGKSTIAKLLQRLHDINTGQILMNGVDIRKLSQHELREQIGYIPQKAFLFSGSIADNLRMGKADASIIEMQEATRIAQAQSFIESLPDGFESRVSQSGKNFSGGQKQRLAIARALIKKASILVFDDSFSALDFKTDSALRSTLKQEVKDTITIIIAQRISTIRDCDQIIVLDEGEIVGSGSHEHLMKTCEVYQEIARSQLA